MDLDLVELLLDWEERCEHGEDCKPELLCVNLPEKAAELRKHTHLLLACNRLLFGDESSTVDHLPSQIGPYEVRGVLGHGGVGVVYSGWDPVLLRPVALKLLQPGFVFSQDARERLSRRFAREAQVLAQLKHPHIVPIYMALTHAGAPCLVMQRVAGGALSQQRERITAGGPKVIVEFMIKVADAVHHAHVQGVLHRDLKPANILLDEHDQPLVSDFGLAKLLYDGDGPHCGATEDSASKDIPHGWSVALTLPGEKPGTPAYMAPEQFDSSCGQITPATDVWALGIVLYELLTGVRPFSGSTPRELADSVCNQPAVSARCRNHQLSRRLDTIVSRSLMRDPIQRFQSAAALAQELRQVYQARQPRRLWIAAAASISVVVLAIILASNKRPSEKLGTVITTVEGLYNVYQQKSVSLLERLTTEGSLELIPRNGQDEPIYFPRQRTTFVTQSKEGLRVHAAGYFNFLEFLPRVPFNRYRIIAKVRLDSRLAREGSSWGIYYCYDQEQSSSGMQRFFHSVSIYEDAIVDSVETPYSYQAILSPRLFAELSSPSEATIRNARWVYPNRDILVKRRLPTQSRSPGWRTMVVNVTQDITTATITDSAGTFSVVPFPRKYEADFVANLRNEHSDLADIPDFPHANSALGIAFSDAACTIESLHIGSIPDAEANR